MKKSILVLAVAAIAATAVSAHAENYGQTVANQSDSPATLFFGTGNLADNFATNSTPGVDGSTIIIGLRAMIAGGGANFYDAAGPNGTYTVPAGDRPGTSKATWDYVYSIDLGSGNANGYTALLTITAPGGATTSYNPLDNGGNDYISDNDENDATGIFEIGDSQYNSIQQNAESPSFTLGQSPSTPTDVDPDDSVLGIYTVTLDLYSTDNPLTAIVTDKIDVDVVPLPASAWSGLALLGGLAAFGGVKRLRKQMA